MTALAVALQDINTPYPFAVHATGGTTVIGINAADRLLRSTDGGKNFVAITVPAPTLGGWQNIGTNGSGLWLLVAGAGGGEYLRSADDGLTWSLITGVLSTSNRFAIHYHNDGYFYTNNNYTGLIRTADGLVWSARAGVFTDVYPAVIMSCGSRLIICGNKYVGWTSDGGTTFNEQLTDLEDYGSYAGMATADGHAVLMPNYYSDVYIVTHDYGDTWEAKTLPFFPASNGGVQSGGIVEGYFTINWQYFWAYSPDNGESFVEFNNEPPQMQAYNAMSGAFNRYSSATKRMHIVEAGSPFWQDHVNCESA